MKYEEYMQFKDTQIEESILITSHEACITLGKNANFNEILEKTDIPIYKSNRGGGTTYHDNGQLIIYPRIHLQKHNLNIKSYIEILENWGIKTLLEFGITAHKNVQPGLWVENRKIAFIGLAVKNGFTQHGIAFNLSECKIENFKKIIPCNSNATISRLDISWQDFYEKIVQNNPFKIKIIYSPLPLTMSQ